MKAKRKIIRKIKKGDPPKKPPTRQDSLDLLDNSRALLAYYYGRKSPYRENFSDPGNDAHERMLDAYNLLKKITRISGIKHIETDRGSIPIEDFDLKDYREDLDENRYRQREIAFPTMDTRAPMGLYDKRITPQQIRWFIKAEQQKGGNDLTGGDVAQIPMYDELAITPWNMLSEEDRKMRLRKYGAKGTPLEGSKNTGGKLVMEYLSKSKPPQAPKGKPVYRPTLKQAPKPRPKEKLINLPQKELPGVKKLNLKKPIKEEIFSIKSTKSGGGVRVETNMGTRDFTKPEFAEYYKQNKDKIQGYRAKRKPRR